MKIRLNLFLLGLLWAGLVSAQDNALIANKLNYTDGQGKRQGRWEKAYRNGQLKYRGTFRNNQPIDSMIRFYSTGVKMADIWFDGNGFSTIRIYSDEGKLVAEGFYTDQVRDSVWVFYSPGAGKVLEEHYQKGKLVGVRKVFFPDGGLAEEQHYSNDLAEGYWVQFFPTGKKREESVYAKGKRNGVFNAYYPSGRLSVTGHYSNDMREGTWKFWDENGKLLQEVAFTNGETKNAWWNEKDNKKLEELEHNRQHLKDPKDYLNNPEELMRGSGF